MDLKEIKEKLRQLVPAFTQRVAPLYFALAWEWEDRELPPHARLEGNRNIRIIDPHIPQPVEIRNTLYELIDSLTEECTDNGTGGLHVWYIPPSETDRGSCGLRFSIEEEDYLS